MAVHFGAESPHLRAFVVGEGRLVLVRSTFSVTARVPLDDDASEMGDTTVIA